jgi:hypothetical protein
MVIPIKLIKFLQLIKFPLSQSMGQNFLLMSNVKLDLLAIEQDQQFNLMSQSDFNSCTKYKPTNVCTGRDVLRTDLSTMCIGDYYLKIFDTI